MSKFRTTKDIVIPAGTSLSEAPWRVIRGKRPGGSSEHVEVVIGHGKDTTSVWTIYVDDALAEGVIEEIRP